MQMLTLSMPLIKSITEIRKNAAGVFKESQKKNQPTIVIQNSKEAGVILTMDLYNQIARDLEKFEDLEDSMELLEAMEKTSKEGISLQDCAKKRKINLRV